MLRLLFLFYFILARGKMEEKISDAFGAFWARGKLPSEPNMFFC